MIESELLGGGVQGAGMRQGSLKGGGVFLGCWFR